MLPLISVLLLLFNGCNLDEVDFSKLSKEINFSPEIVAPIARANISVWDLLQSANTENEDLIVKDPNGLIKIIYKQEELIKYNVSNLVPSPGNQNFSSGDKAMGDIFPKDVDISSRITLNELVDKLNGSLDAIIPINGMYLPFPAIPLSNLDALFSLEAISDFTSLTLSKGIVEISLENKLKVPLTIEGSFFDLGRNRSITDFTFVNIAPNASQTLSVKLAGVLLSNQLAFKMKTLNTIGSSMPVNINLADYFKISFNLTELGVSKGNLRITESQTMEGSVGAFEFDFPEPDIKAFRGVLQKGSLSVKSNNTSQMTGTINLKLNEVKKNGVPMEISIPLGGNSTIVDLSGADINFSADPAFPYNRIPYTYSLIVNSTPGLINYSSTDIIKMDISLNGIEFKSITGDFGNRSRFIDPGEFNMDLDLFSKIDGSFKLANPSLVLTIHNSIGIPASVALDFMAVDKDGLSVPLNPPPFDIPVPANLNAGIATKNVVFDKSNSQIVDFIARLLTGKILYSGQVDFNKNYLVTAQNPNFMDIDASLGMDLTLELPLELQVSGINFKDTTSMSGGDYDNFETADLIVNSTNGIPLDFNLQLFFVDTISKIQHGASEGVKILSAAQVNTSGEITPAQSSQTFSLTKTDMNNLRKSNGLVFSGTVSSPDSGSTVGSIYSNSEIKLNVVIKSKINL